MSILYSKKSTAPDVVIADLVPNSLHLYLPHFHLEFHPWK